MEALQLGRAPEGVGWEGTSERNTGAWRPWIRVMGTITERPSGLVGSWYIQWEGVGDAAGKKSGGQKSDCWEILNFTF